MYPNVVTKEKKRHEKYTRQVMQCLHIDLMNVADTTYSQQFSFPWTNLSVARQPSQAHPKFTEIKTNEWKEMHRLMRYGIAFAAAYWSSPRTFLTVKIERFAAECGSVYACKAHTVYTKFLYTFECVRCFVYTMFYILILTFHLTCKYIM